MKLVEHDDLVVDLKTAIQEPQQVQLMHGDCLELMKSIPDGSIDLILADPPYGTTECKWDTVIPFNEMWAEIHRVMKPCGTVLLFGTEPFSSLLRASNIKQFRYDWIYEKSAATGFLNAKKQPLRAHEIISVFYKKQPTYNPQKTTGHRRKLSERTDVNSECYGKAIKRVAYDSTDRYPRSVQKFSSDKQKESFHPTQKPVALTEYMVNTYTNQGDVVLDFVMGSGTTGVACVNTGRRFIGIELDENYYQIAADRIERAQSERTGQGIV